MFKNFFTTLLCFFFFLTLKAEIVNEIKIKGNKRISEETIIIYGNIETKKDYTERDIDLILKNLNDTNFFENIEIKVEQNILTVKVTEHPIINQLIIVGEKSNNYVDRIKKIMNVKSKRPYIKSLLAKDINNIKNLYSSIGYNSTKVVSKLKKIDSDTYDLLIEIERGTKTKIESIKFVGNQQIKSKRLREIVASEEDKFWKIISRNTNLSENLIQLDIRLLSNYYKSLGFYDVKINSNLAEISNQNTANLIYSIEEGKRYIIKKITTNLDDVFDKKIFFPVNKVYKKYIGEYYSPFKVKKILDEIDTIIENNRLQFVEHNVEEIIEGDAINIVFNIFEGNKILVERINIIGNNVTNEDVVRGELKVDEGDPFTKVNFERSIADIRSRNIFKKVDYKISNGSKNDLRIIDITVEEKATGEISAGAGVGTNGGSFAFNIRENNWLGEGKAVSFDIDVDQESLTGTLSYNDPNYNYLGNSIFYSISSEENDKPDQGYENTIFSARAGTAFEQYKDVNAKLGLSVSYDDLRTLDTASDALKKQSGSFEELAGDYGFTYDKRNRSFNPTSGSIVTFGQSIPVIADKSYLSNLFAASGYKSFNNENIIGAAKFYLSTIDGLGSDDVRLSKRKGLSSSRLRGFEKNKVGPKDGTDHIGGNYAAALNLESKLPNFLPEDTNTDVSLFLDFGNVWGVDYDSSINESNKIRSSAGVSAGWMSPIGPMTFTFSQNISKADTDETESFNFNLGTTF